MTTDRDDDPFWAARPEAPKFPEVPKSVGRGGRAEVHSIVRIPPLAAVVHEPDTLRTSKEVADAEVERLTAQYRRVWEAEQAKAKVTGHQVPEPPIEPKAEPPVDRIAAYAHRMGQARRAKTVGAVQEAMVRRARAQWNDHLLLNRARGFGR